MSGDVNLQAFDGRSLQAARTILSLFPEIAVAISAIDTELKARLQQKDALIPPASRCPTCGGAVSCMAVNVPGKKCRQVGGDYKSLSFCINESCGYSEYSKIECI